MRRQIQEVPRQLPHARLFLDDLEAINNIMLEEMSEQFKAEVARYAVPDAGEDSIVPTTFEPRITYLLGQVEMDSLDGLRLVLNGLGGRWPFALASSAEVAFARSASMYMLQGRR